MSDTGFLNRILLACSNGNRRLFRNSVGLGWVGKTIRVQRPTQVTLSPGDVLVKNARALHAGLMKGSGDEIGWETITVTPAMVGARVAVFLSVEGKQGKDRVSTEQVTWRDQVNAAGGIAIVVTSPEDAQQQLVERAEALVSGVSDER